MSNGDDALDDAAFDHAARHSKWLEVLFQREAPGLLAYLRRHASNTAEAHDLAQDAFLGIAKCRIDQLRNPSAYLQRIARNLIIDRARRHRLQARIIDARPYEDHPEVAQAPQQSLGIEANDMMRLYQAAVLGLPPKTREIFLLHRRDELTYAEIAARLGLSVKTIEYHIAAALKHIRKALDQE